MRTLSTVVMMGLLAVGACGGASGEPLISGSVTGSFAGEPFTPDVGFATLYMSDPVIGIGDGDLHCGSENQNSPPSGTSVAISMPSFDVGTYTNVFVDLIQNIDGLDGAGSNAGTVTITASTADSIAATIAYAYTDPQGATYSVDGTFEVVRCAP